MFRGRPKPETETTFELDLYNVTPSSEELADELERIAKLLREDYREGEVVIDGARGWWKSRAI